jgi:hypothetical protein
MEFTVEMLRTLKGAPLSILMAMVLARQPVSAQYLEAVTGYTDKPVQAGLRMLSEFGYITRNGRYDWQLANTTEQLPLMYQELEETENLTPPTLTGTGQTPPQPSPSGEGEVGKDTELFRVGIIPCPGSLVVDSISNNLDLIINPLLARDADTEFFRVSQSPPKSTRPPEPGDEVSKAALLDQYGIREPMRSKLVRDRSVTDRAIAYHCETAPNPGLAIYRIRNGWKIPASWKPGRNPGEEEYLKYLDASELESDRFHGNGDGR